MSFSKTIQFRTVFPLITSMLRAKTLLTVLYMIASKLLTFQPYMKIPSFVITSLSRSILGLTCTIIVSATLYAFACPFRLLYKRLPKTFTCVTLPLTMSSIQSWTWTYPLYITASIQLHATITSARFLWTFCGTFYKKSMYTSVPWKSTKFTTKPMWTFGT